VELLTERLVLRDFVIEDLSALEGYQSDPRYLAFYEPEHGPHRSRVLLEKCIADSKEVPRQNFQLAIVDRASTSQPIGNCGVRRKGFEPGTAEFGLELAPHAWGKGFATEAATRLLGFAFEELGLEEIVGFSVTQNEPVNRLVERLGFELIGTRPGPPWMQERGWTQSEWRMKKPL
jgi:ribosomal-protein-alanine N-acetyltransferase